MEPIYFVYKLIFQNGLIYIGASKTDVNGSYTTRYRKHLAASKSNYDLPLYKAWREIGSPILEIVSKHNSKEESMIAEINAISESKSYDENYGYNIQYGGNGSHAFSSDKYRKIMQEKVWGNDGWKKKISLAQQSPEFKKAASERTRKQMQNGGSLHLSKMFKGRGDVRSVEGKESQRQKMKEYTKTEEGRAALRRGYEAWKSNPENLIKNRIALDAWRESDANKEQCKRMAKLSASKCSIKVRDNETGIVYNSQREMAKALGVTDGAITNRVKKGKATRL